MALCLATYMDELSLNRTSEFQSITPGFQSTVSRFTRTWRNIPTAELQNLLNSEFWLLSSNTRNSGAGFVLKRTLSRAKSELERANNST